MEGLTPRDREYLRAIFLMDGKNRPVGPSELANSMNISKVGALQKMKRLDSINMGDYIENKGLKLSKKGVQIVESDIRRHHILEIFFEKKLEMDFNDACAESETIGPFVSDEFVKKILSHLDEEISCKCGSCIEPPFEPEDLKECHWCQKVIKNEEKT